MAHVYHRAVYTVFFLVRRYYAGKIFPQFRLGVFLFCQMRVVISYRVVCYVIEIIVIDFVFFAGVVHPEIRNVPPCRLNIVRRPVGERAGDDDFPVRR